MNKILYILLAACALFLTVSCGEDDLMPSEYEKNWLVVEDNPNDALDHLRYEVFQKTGIPVYYNDTIGCEQRTTLAGQPYTYYEVLQVFYSPGSATPSEKTANYTLPQNRSEVLPVVEFLRDEVFPRLPAAMYVPSVLLTDTLNSASGTVAFKGLNTIVLSNVRRFASLGEQGRKAYRAAFLRAVVASSLMAFEEEWLEENFFALTYAVNPDNIGYLYSTATVGYMVYRALSNFPVTDQKLSTLGFIGARPNTLPTAAERMKYVPEKSQDVSHYCEAIFAYPQEEFVEMHANEPVVLAKYQVMRQKLLQYGFELE